MSRYWVNRNNWLIFVIVSLGILLYTVLASRAADFWGGFAGGAVGGAAGSVIGGYLQQQFNRPAAPQYAPPQYAPAPQYVPAQQPQYIPEQRVLTPEAIAYCSRKFKSWDLNSGLYRGFDGNFYRCP
jgi:hypothetical protein